MRLAEAEDARVRCEERNSKLVAEYTEKLRVNLTLVAATEDRLLKEVLELKNSVQSLLLEKGELQRSVHDRNLQVENYALHQLESVRQQEAHFEVLNGMRAASAALEQAFESKSKEHADLLEVLSRYESQLTVLESDTTVKSSELSEINQELSLYKEKTDKLLDDLRLLEVECTSGSQDLQLTMQAYDTCKLDLSNALESILQLESEKNSMATSLMAIREEKIALERSLVGLQNETNALVSQADEALGVVGKLCEERDLQMDALTAFMSLGVGRGRLLGSLDRSALAQLENDIASFSQSVRLLEELNGHLQNDLDRMSTEKSVEERERVKLGASLHELQKDFDALVTSKVALEASMDDSIRSLQNESASQGKTIQQLKSENKVILDANKVMSDETTSLKSVLSSADTKLSQQALEMESLKVSADRYERQVAQLSKSLSVLESDCNRAKSEQQSLVLHLSDKTHSVDLLTNQISLLHSDVEIISQRNTQEAKKLYEQLSTSRLETAEAKTTILSQRVELAKAQHDYNLLVEDRNALALKSEALTAEIKSLQQHLVEARERQEVQATTLQTLRNEGEELRVSRRALEGVTQEVPRLNSLIANMFEQVTILETDKAAAIDQAGVMTAKVDELNVVIEALKAEGVGRADALQENAVLSVDLANTTVRVEALIEEVACLKTAAANLALEKDHLEKRARVEDTVRLQLESVIGRSKQELILAQSSMEVSKSVEENLLLERDALAAAVDAGRARTSRMQELLASASADTVRLVEERDVAVITATKVRFCTRMYEFNLTLYNTEYVSCSLDMC
jgi:chromosome segregation ATPase